MNTSLRRTVIRFCLVGALATLSAATPLKAAFTVETHDGRILHGQVDEQTDETLLWIRQEKEQIVLTTSVPWSEILSATHQGKALPLAELPELLRKQTTSEPEGFFVRQTITHTADVCQSDCNPIRPTSRSSQRFPTKVRSLEVEAFLVNLDRDVEPDGLEVFITALDEFGLPVPVRGNLNVRLWGERIHPNGSHLGYEDLQQWNQAVKRVDFSAEGSARYAMRFRTVRPSFDFGLHSEAMVHVRLGASGQGNFAASVPVEIRRFEPFRDRLQHAQGSRFLRDELTGEVRRFDSARGQTLRIFDW